MGKAPGLPFDRFERIDLGCAHIGMPETLANLLYDNYLPFRLYAEHKNGVTPAQLAASFSLSVPWVEERIEAARLCIEKQVRLELVN